MRLTLTELAHEQLATILSLSLFRNGPTKAESYRLLLWAAIRDVLADPYRLGAVQSKGTPGVFSYEIAHSRRRVASGRRVGSPWHKLVYMPTDGGGVTILAIVGKSYPAENVVPRDGDEPI